MKYTNLNNTFARATRGTNARKPAVRVSEQLIAAAKRSIDDALALLATRREGLTPAEAEQRLERYGKNEVVHEKAPAWYIQLFKAFLNPFIIVLLVLAVVSLFLDVILAAPGEQDLTSVIIITVMVLIGVLLRFWQEFRSNRAAEQLKAMVRTTATVQRQGEGKREVDLAEIVPGDIVHLAAGDMIPADVRLLTSKDLSVSQAVLTGESLPVEKYDTLGSTVAKAAAGSALHNDNPLEIESICFMGTNVVSGTATALVVATGSQTYFGSMAKALVGQRALTSFDRGVNQVSWVLIRFMLVMVPIIFLINGLTKGDWLGALLFGLAVAVGLTPEMLPMIVTANLAKGAVEMARHKTIIKRLNAIQNFGAMDTLCTDKTGTLTQDKVVLVRYLDVHGNEHLDVLKYAYLNSFYQTGLKNLLDVAVLEHDDVQKLGRPQERYTKVDEIPFDFVRRRMTVVVENGDGRHLLICKGAVEEMLSVCAFVEDEGEIKPLTEEMRRQVKMLAYDFNQDGLRVLLVGYKVVENRAHPYGVQDETALILAGYIAFLS